MHDIFSHFISRDTKDDGRRVGYILWFVDTFPSFEFKGEDFIMRLYCEYCARLGVPMKSQYFSVYLSTELRDRKSTRLNSSHQPQSRMPSSA